MAPSMHLHYFGSHACGTRVDCVLDTCSTTLVIAYMSIYIKLSYEHSTGFHTGKSIFQVDCASSLNIAYLQHLSNSLQPLFIVLLSGMT